MRQKKIELMAPVGNFASLQAALQGGADSVFLGVGKLNMRAGSSINFTVGDLAEVVALCHARGVKVYQTVNTVVYEEELEDLRALLQESKRAGVDAIIASDQATILLAQELGLRIHLSTQLSISNSLTIDFYKQWADVVVLARELNLKQVQQICQQIAQRGIKGPSGELVKVEMFAHGALCMAISGKCYLSLHAMAKSANRGECNQICRRSFTLHETETDNAIAVDNAYLLSPKDLCTIHFLDKLIASGVQILKLEGRARSPEYVKVVTACYREAIDAVLDGSYNRERVAEWEERLRRVFNRGFWDGYYLGKRLGEWSHTYGSHATERKKIVGQVTNYFSKLEVAEVRLDAGELHKGDRLYVIGETTGVLEYTLDEMRVEDAVVERVTKGSRFSVKIPLVRRGDKVYLREVVEVEEDPLG